MFHVKPSEDFQQQNLLSKFLATHNVILSENTLDKLFEYADLVVEETENQNLISKKDAEKFLSRQITDSLIPYIYIGKNFANTENLCWADMGSGGGCPVFPLAIVLPNIHFYAVEPRTKRVLFMQSAAQNLGLKNLTVVGKRFETSELSNLDFISCRALSTFENDWERAKVALKPKGIFATLKSFNNVENLLGDPNINITKYTLPQEDQVYAFVTRGND